MGYAVSERDSLCSLGGFSVDRPSDRGTSTVHMCGSLSHPMEAARDDWDTCFDKDAMLLLPLTTEFDALLL